MPGGLNAPRYDLAAAKKASFEIGTSCARRACVTLGDDVQAARRYIQKLFKSLALSDFSETVAMPQRVGRPRFGDVYGKRDSYCIWFIKFEHDPETGTLVMSCHEAERPILLADGRTLRKSS